MESIKSRDFALGVILPLIFFFQPSYAQLLNGWEEIGTQTYQSAQFLTGHKIIVVGSQGHILLSSDAGASWRTNNQRPNINLPSVSFIDSLNGIICAQSGEIFGSSDGGNTWALESTIQSSHLNKILMLSIDTVFACGNGGHIFRSVNNGKNWDSLTSGISLNLRNLYFLTSRMGYAIGDSGMVLKTRDAGNSWTLLPTDTTFQLLGIDFLDSLHGAVCGQWGLMYNTSDGGKSWHKTFIDTSHQFLMSSISYHTLSHLTAVSFGGGFFESNDGATTWSAIHRPKELQDITILYNGGFREERDKGWAVGYSGVILLSSDSGKSWVQSASYPVRDANITDMLFFDSSSGYAVGDHNLVLWTLNGGETWKSLTQSNDLQRLLKIYSPFPDTAWVLSWNGWLIKTTDSWKTFHQEPPPVVPNVDITRIVSPTDLFMVNRNIGYLVGDSIIWKTTDAGMSWSATIWHGYRLPTNFIPAGGILDHITFPNEQTGFVTGSYTILLDSVGNTVHQYGIVFRTSNGGQTWDTLNYGYRNRIYGIYFWNERNGIITCDSGNVLKTSDGGDSWHLAYQIPNMIPGQSHLSDVNFLTPKIGYITANPSKIFITTDAGESWSLDLDLHITTYSQNLSSIGRIIFPDSNTVMVSGYQGMLRKKIDLNKLSVAKTESVKVDHYAWITLKQNPVSTILYCKLYWYLEQSSGVSLNVYDILGRSVMDLSRNLKQVNSANGVEINANISSLPSGVYLLVLDAGGYLKSERFVVSK